MTINTKTLFNVKSTALPWLVLGIVYVLLNVLAVGIARQEFQWGILYALGFVGIALVLAENSPSLISGSGVAVIGVAVVFAQLEAIPITPALVLGILGFMMVVAAGLDIIDYKTKGDFRVLTLVPMFLLLAWTMLYFYGRITNPAYHGSLNLPTVLNHGGIAILCFDGILRVTGASKKYYLTMIGLGAGVIGAVWLTEILGWGLALIPTV
jgi:hypothetical protein